jgi:hypothetical protein
MADTATLQARLEEAEAAYHQLRTGARRVRVKYEGREVEYDPTNATDLAGYIAELKAQLGLRPRRAIGVRLA